MILDCSRSVDAIPSLDPVTREALIFRTGPEKENVTFNLGMEKIFSFVSENYHIENTMDGCLVFRLNAH